VILEEERRRVSLTMEKRQAKNDAEGQAHTNRVSTGPSESETQIKSGLVNG
jgi:hypothetical protein